MARARDYVSGKIDHLFHTVRREDGREYTYDEVEQGTDLRVSRSYVWKLRHGRNSNPSLDVIEALSNFFGVEPEYFFVPKDGDDDRSRRIADIAALLQDSGVRSIAERARGLSPTSIEAINSMIDNLHAIEKPRGRAAVANGVDAAAASPVDAA
jgi:transcriptional regulator with XRE-family HTH domain